MKGETNDEIKRLKVVIEKLNDIEAIKQLKHAYCRCNDGGWPMHGPSHMGPTADLFVEDGVWDGRPVAPLCQGRDAIRSMIINYRALSPFCVHDVMNPDINISGDSATGHWHALVFSTMKDGASHLSIGEYHDEYVKTKEGWRIKSLRYTQIRTIDVTGKITDPVGENIMNYDADS